MKTKNLKHSIGGVMVAVLSFIAIGCNDGVLPPEQSTNLGVAALTPPEVKSFTAAPMEMDAGGTVTLSWDVGGADKVEITSSGARTNFNFSTQDKFTGSTEVNNLQETTTFILTATKMPGGGAGSEGGQPAGGTAGGMRKQVSKDAPPSGGGDGGGAGGDSGATTPAPAVSRKTVTVTVRNAAGQLNIAEFYAEAPGGQAPGGQAPQGQTPDGQAPQGQGSASYTIDAGQTTVLHWSVTPADVQITLTSSTGEQPIVGPCESSNSQAMEAGGENAGANPIPASGCATVQPTEDTTYTLTATAGDQHVSKDLVIHVSKAPAVEYFKANGSTALRVSSYPSQVELSWRVRPSMAKVTITANDAAITGLPSGGNAEGSVTVTVSKDTTFSLTGSVTGQTDATAQLQITSDLSAINCDQFVVSAPTSPVFAGEQVKISWQLPASASGIQSVKVSNADPVAASQGYATVPAKSSVSVQFLTSAGTSLCPKSVNLAVVSLDKISSDNTVKVVNDPAAPTAVYAGLDLGFNDGKIRVAHYQPSAEMIDIPFFGTLKGYDKMAGKLNASFMKNAIQTFPVNAVAIDSAGTMFTASTGAILYKKSGADGAWTTLAPLFRFDDHGDYDGTHPTCFGKTQTGRKSGIKGDLVALGQVCDMLTTADGKLFVATDRGLYVNDNIGTYLTAHDDKTWHGKEATNPLYPKVINDVAIDSGGTIYAAGAMGVYMSIDAGHSFQPLKDGGMAYSVSIGTGVDGDKVVVAGVDGGVIIKKGNADWTNTTLDSSATYSVVADPYAAGVIYAGTGAGLYVSRDSGATFTQVALEGDASVVRSIAVLYSGDPIQGAVKSYIYVGTESGLMKAYIPEVKMEPVPLSAPPVGPDPDRGQSSVPPAGTSASGSVTQPQ